MSPGIFCKFREVFRISIIMKQLNGYLDTLMWNVFTLVLETFFDKVEICKIFKNISGGWFWKLHDFAWMIHLGLKFHRLLFSGSNLILLLLFKDILTEMKFKCLQLLTKSFSLWTNCYNNYVNVAVRWLLLLFQYLSGKKDTHNKRSLLLGMSFKWSLIYYSIYHGKSEKHIPVV